MPDVIENLNRFLAALSNSRGCECVWRLSEKDSAAICEMYIKHTQYVNIGMISEDSQDIVYSEGDHSLIRMMIMMLVVKRIKDPAKERHFLRWGVSRWLTSRWCDKLSFGHHNEKRWFWWQWQLVKFKEMMLFAYFWLDWRGTAVRTPWWRARQWCESTPAIICGMWIMIVHCVLTVQARL